METAWKERRWLYSCKTSSSTEVTMSTAWETLWSSKSILMSEWSLHLLSHTSLGNMLWQCLADCANVHWSFKRTEKMFLSALTESLFSWYFLVIGKVKQMCWKSLGETEVFFYCLPYWSACDREQIIHRRYPMPEIHEFHAARSKSFDICWSDWIEVCLTDDSVWIYTRKRSHSSLLRTMSRLRQILWHSSRHASRSNSVWHEILSRQQIDH